MMRFSLALLVGLASVGAAGAASWADAMFEELSRDFGSVPSGPTLTHHFRLTNKTAAPVRLGSIRVSCGCVAATALHSDLAPGQTTSILVQMDTRRFHGIKNVTIYVQFERPQWEEVRLWVQANSRDDFTVTPDTLAFGQVKRATTPAASVIVSFLGNGQWQITGVHSDSNYVQPLLTELRREPAEVAYQLTARLRADAPVGKWYTDLWLQTNNPVTPRVRVPLTVEIESALSVSPGSVALGQVKVGAEAERKVIVRGVKPFRITGFKGTDAELTAQDSTADSKAVHVVTVKLKPAKAGELKRALRVLTDLPEEGSIEFQTQAQVVP
jgi:hypothetical protein